MNTKKEKRGHLLLYLVIAIVVLLSLIVLPLADTDHPDSSDGNTQSMEEGALAVNGTVTGSSLTVDSVTGSAINVETVTGGAIDVENPKKDDPEQLPKKTVYDYEDDNIIVKAVFSDATAVPDHAQLLVTPITEATDSEQYSEVEACINDSIEADNKTVTSFLAYDIYFLADGVEYEPELGIVNVTLQYKNEILEDSIKKVSDEIKVLHLKETAEGIRVEDVTQEVSLVEYDEDQKPSDESQIKSEEGQNDPKEEIINKIEVEGDSKVSDSKVSDSKESDSNVVDLKDSESNTNDSKEGVKIEKESELSYDADNKTEELLEKGIESNANDAITFATDSFSTFVVTGISYSKPVIDVKMQFVDGNGNIDNSVSGIYYLNVTNANEDRYNLALNVINGKAEAQISGVYDRNGQMNAGQLFPLKVGSYNVVLFGYAEGCDDTFKWLETNPTNFGCIKYKTGSELYENYIVTELPTSLTVGSGVGDLKITATPKVGTKISSSQILTALSPVSPYSVFAKELYLKSHMDGCIAVQTATFSGNFGNTSNSSYYTYSPNSFITIKKIYNGTSQKTFRFGLFKNDSYLYETTTITLPTASGSNTASATFANVDTARDTVYELDDNNNKLKVGDGYNGYTLTSVGRVDTTTLSKINFTSYVENIKPGETSTPLQGTKTGEKNILVVGSRYSVRQIDNNIKVFDGGTELISTTSSNGSIYAAPAGSFPINFDNTLCDMAAFSASLASALSTDTVMVKNMTIKELNSKQGKENLTFNTNGRMLLLNIDATDADTISLFANVPLIVNGKGANDDWNDQVKNIVVNIFTRSSSGYSAYTGGITNANAVMGILLVPCARVNDMNGSYNGNIVAQYVNVRHEIHGNTMGIKTIEAIYTFVNSARNNIVLPMTGGIGTQVFYHLGAGILLLGILLSILCYLDRRKKPNLSG